VSVSVSSSVEGVDPSASYQVSTSRMYVPSAGKIRSRSIGSRFWSALLLTAARP